MMLPSAAASCLFAFLNIPVSAIGFILFLSGSSLLIDKLIAFYLRKQLASFFNDRFLVIKPHHPVEFEPSSLLLSCVGFLLFGFGAIASCCSNRKAFQSTYSVAFGTLLFTLIGFTGYFIAFNEQISTSLKEHLIADYTYADSTEHTDLFLNFIQVSLGCCGVFNGSDYLDALRFNRTWLKLEESSSKELTQMVVPPTCCTAEALNATARGQTIPISLDQPIVNCVFNTSSSFSNYHLGCVNKFVYDVLPVVGPGFCSYLIVLIGLSIFALKKTNHHRCWACGASPCTRKYRKHPKRTQIQKRLDTETDDVIVLVTRETSV